MNLKLDLSKLIGGGPSTKKEPEVLFTGTYSTLDHKVVTVENGIIKSVE